MFASDIGLYDTLPASLAKEADAWKRHSARLIEDTSAWQTAGEDAYQKFWVGHASPRLIGNKRRRLDTT